MSYTQRRRLQIQRTLYVVMVSLLAVVFIALILGAIRGMPGMLIVPMFVFAGLIILLSRMNTLSREIREGKVLCVAGRVVLDIANTRTHQQSNFYIHVEGERFTVRKDGLLAFKNGDPYTIYYSPYKNTMLSAEWLRDDPFEAN